jgi:hypothetical protein
MRDKAKQEFEKVYSKYKQFIKIAEINYDKSFKLESVDIQLITGLVAFLIEFDKKSTTGGVDADVVKKFNVSKSDILNGNFAKSFNGFFKYDSNGKLRLIMGLGYVFGNDIEMVTPKMIGNVYTYEMNLSTLWIAWVSDRKEIYRKQETPSRKTDWDIGVRQGPAGKGILGTKGKASTFVYIVREIKRISEKSGLPIYGKAKEVSVKRVDQKSADNYVKSMYSYKKTGKLYFVELKSLK